MVLHRALAGWAHDSPGRCGLQSPGSSSHIRYITRGRGEMVERLGWKLRMDLHLVSCFNTEIFVGVEGDFKKCLFCMGMSKQR